MKFLFPYMARWKAVNWTRYHQIFTILAEMGHEVHVIQAPPLKSYETNFQEISVDVPVGLHLHEIKIHPLVWNARIPLNKLVKKGYYSFRSAKKAGELIDRYDIDVLYLYNIPQYPLLKFDSCLKIFDFADDYLAMLRHELRKLHNPLLINLGSRILEGMIEKSDMTCVVSQVLADSIKTCHRNVHVVPNGVNIDDISVGCGTHIKNNFKNPVVGFIGSFEYFIDFELILSSAEILKEYTFLLVGTGREFQRVQEEMRKRGLENVVLTGGVPHGEVFSYIDAMDVCLNIFKKIPISHGTCPIKLFEYLAMKKPVISTRLDELKHIDTGFLFYADTAHELKESLHTIFSDAELVSARVEEGFKLVERKYQWRQIANDLVDKINAIRKQGRRIHPEADSSSAK